MWKGLSVRERRYLWNGAGSAFAIVIGLVGLWASPLSPIWMDSGAVKAGDGDPEAALQAYVDQADWGPDTRRGESLWRAAVLADVHLDQPGRCMAILEQLIEAIPEHARVADAHARVAQIHRLHHQDPVRAATRWLAAASVAPHHPEAGRWMLDAGLAFAEAGDLERANAALDQAATRPDQVVAARLAQGRLHLRSAPAKAYADYDAAYRAGASGEAKRLAQLGMATALEYLDRREQALAELEDARDEGVTDAALERRRDRLWARRSN
jgi:hypothetical protein